MVSTQYIKSPQYNDLNDWWRDSNIGFDFLSSLFSQPILVSQIGFSDEVHSNSTLKCSCRAPC